MNHKVFCIRVNGQKLLYLCSHCLGTFHSAVSETEQTGEIKTVPLFGDVCKAVWRPLAKIMSQPLYYLYPCTNREHRHILTKEKKIPKALKIFFCLHFFLKSIKPLLALWRNLISVFKFEWPSSIKIKAAWLTEIELSFWNLDPLAINLSVYFWCESVDLDVLFKYLSKTIPAWLFNVQTEDFN